MTFTPSKCLRVLATAIFLVSIVSAAHAEVNKSVAPEATNVVASEMASQNLPASFFTSGSNWVYPNAMAGIADTAPERTVKFGDSSVALGFSGLDPKAVYAIELVFLSDSDTRALSANAGAQVLDANIPIPNSKILQNRYKIPSAAYADGKLTITINLVSGENAILSGFRLYSSQPGKVNPSTQNSTAAVPNATAAAAPDGATLIASEMVAQNLSPSFFVTGSNYVYGSMTGVADNAPEHTVKFGDSVTLSFAGLNPKAAYTIELVFLSDSDTRVETATAGGQSLDANIAIPNGKIVQPRYKIPAGAYSDGKLKIVVGLVAGENAVVSGFRLYSSEPGKVVPAAQ